MRFIGMTMRRTIESNQIEVSRFPGWDGYRDISHFVTTRHGGVSRGAFATLNLGIHTPDNPESVRKNITLLAGAIGIAPERIYMPRQTHGDRIRAIDATFLSWDAFRQREYLEGVDALMTDVSGICVSVSTADCVPILLYDPVRRVVGAVHAGWRGTVLRVARKAIEGMMERYACDSADICAGIGPSISKAAFEVGEEVVLAFLKAGFPLERWLSRSPVTGKAHIDLWGINRFLLEEIGVSPNHIEVAGICTYEHHADYFSARRLGVASGRMLSGIFLRENRMENNIY